ncbi:MAG: hypothetical protein ACLU99_09995 [Alphaproteobacteria bacterium]
MPSIAAVLIGLLLVFPSLKKDTRDFKLDITRPKQGELEKLHVENTVFYITDKDNKVNNFLAQNIDETAPGSKIIKTDRTRRTDSRRLHQLGQHQGSDRILRPKYQHSQPDRQCRNFLQRRYDPANPGSRL